MASFPDKLAALMRRRGLTTRDVGKAVGLDHSAIARWLKGTKPYASSIAKLAEYFDVPVDLLTDDRLELPPVQRVEDGPEEYLVSAPLKLASEAASKLTGTDAERQAAFERYMNEARRLRTLAEEAAHGDSAIAIKLFEQLVAKWMTVAPTVLNYDELLAEALNDAAARKKLEELKSRAEAAERRSGEEKGHRHAS